MAGPLQRLARLWRHRWTEGQVHRAFPPQVLLRLERAVSDSESQHRGQIRLCVEGGLPYSYIWRDATARERAVGLFGKLRVWDTEDNTGVLIYLLLAEHAIEIVADRAVAHAIPASTWEDLLQAMQKSFQRADFAQGMEDALHAVSDLLITHFPQDNAAPAPASDLPNAPVVQRRFFKDR
jgi:hypothetical protein